MLKNKGRLIVQSTINHSYPFCWRYVGSSCYRGPAAYPSPQIRDASDLPRHPGMVRPRAADRG